MAGSNVPKSPKSKTAMVQASSARTVDVLVVFLEKEGKRRFSSWVGVLRSTLTSRVLTGLLPFARAADEGIGDLFDREPTAAVVGINVLDEPFEHEAES